MGCKDGPDEALDWRFPMSAPEVDGLKRAADVWAAVVRATSITVAEAAENFAAYCETLAAMERSGELVRCEACGYLICDCEAAK